MIHKRVETARYIKYFLNTIKIAVCKHAMTLKEEEYSAYLHDDISTIGA